MNVKIKTYFIDRFNLKEDEYNKIKLLFFYSFFLGLFIAFYFVPANSNFLNTFGHLELPYAYIVSGIVGVISISFYSIVQKKRKSKTLFLFAIIGMAFIGFTVWILEFLLRKESLVVNYETKSKLINFLNFFIFIWAWPFIALVATITGGLALRLFNLLQVKKFYGIINLGGVFSAIISYFTINQLLKLLGSEFDLILIGLFGLFGAACLLFYIYKKFPERKDNIPSDYYENHKGFMGGIFKNNYIRFITLGAIFSAILIYITDYGFLVTVKQSSNLLKNGIHAVPRFLSIIYGALKIGEFIISLLSGRILSKKGIRFGLIALPLCISIIFILAYGQALFFGYETIGFLALMSSGKMLERIVRRGIDDPSFNVLYQTLDDDKKLFVQTRVGILQQFAIALAGLILLALNLIIIQKDNRFNLLNFPLFALILVLFALFIAYSLYIRYKRRIKQILADKKIFKFDYVEKDIFAIDTLKMYILSEDSKASKFCTIILAETNPRSLETYASFLIKINDPIIRKAVLANIDSTYNEKLIPIIEKVGDQISFKNKEMKKLFLEAFFKIDYSEINELDNDKVKLYALSNDVKKQITATKYIFRKKQTFDRQIIKHLLQSDHKSIKLAAIKIASRTKDKELWEDLIKLLENQEYTNIVTTTLIDIGDPILMQLKKYSEKVKSLDIIKKLIQIYAKIGTPLAQRILVELLNYPDRKIQHLVILSLQYSGFIAREDTISTIRNKIYSVVENIVWFLVSIKDLVREKNTLRLIQSLDLERIISLEDLFTLLSFTQSPDIIELIKINIIGENTIFALELIDNYIAPEIKKIILPLFEPIRLGKKIKRFKPYFFYRPIGSLQRIIDIIISDSSKVDIWSQTMAIELLNKYIKVDEFKNFDFSSTNIPTVKNWTKAELENIKSNNKISPVQAILLCLYHPSELVFTSALKILLKNEFINNSKLESFIPENRKTLFVELSKTSTSTLDKIKKLRRVQLFFSVPERALIDVVNIIVHKKLKIGQSTSFLLNGEEYVILLVRGELIAKNKKQELKYFKKTLIISGLNIPSDIEKLVSTKDSQIILIKRSRFFNLLASNNDLVNNLLQNVRL